MSIRVVTMNGEVKYQGDVGPRGAVGPRGEQGIQGPKGERGEQGIQGIDGVSPVVEVSKNGKTTTISITDESGTHTTQINDGEISKEELDSALNEAKSYTDTEIATFDFIKVVNSLPQEGLPNKIYLVPKTDTQTQDLFDEYVWVNNTWEWITTKQVEIDLTNYATKKELESKVDKIQGKGLSTNDYTTEEKNKLESLPHNPITEETDPTVPNYVKSITTSDISNWNNKSDFSGNYNDLTERPAIPSKTSDLNNDSNFVADSNYTHTDNNYTNDDKNKLAGISENANNYSLPTASETVLGGVKVGSGLSINNGILSATGGTGNVSSDTINSIVVVDELPEVEEEGVLYLIKESVTPVVENLYPDQIESTQSDGFTVTFKEKNVIVDGSNSSVSVWGWTNKFNMNLEANKTYYLQFANVSGSFDDSQRIANSDGVVTNVSLSAFDSSNNETQLVSQVERTASSVYDKYVFTPTQVYNEFRVSLQVKKLNVFDNWKCLITIAEKVGE